MPGYSIVITDYNPQWPILYTEEKVDVLNLLGHQLVAIEHVGSTAVPGLGAKPIIDIMVAVRQLTDIEKCIELLSDIGYEYISPEEAGMPERRYFRKGTRQAHTHHLHMVERASEFWERHLLFRDFLRAHNTVAQQYYHLKKKLADQYGSDRKSYTESKMPFIEFVIARARIEHESHSSTR